MVGLRYGVDGGAGAAAASSFSVREKYTVRICALYTEQKRMPNKYSIHVHWAVVQIHYRVRFPFLPEKSQLSLSVCESVSLEAILDGCMDSFVVIVAAVVAIAIVVAVIVGSSSFFFSCSLSFFGNHYNTAWVIVLCSLLFDVLSFCLVPYLCWKLKHVFIIRHSSSSSSSTCRFYLAFS